jgi:hypothetical protein
MTEPMTDSSLIRALTDRFAVLDVVSSCLLAVDARNWAAVSACFTEDADIDFGGRIGAVRGGLAAAEVLRRTFRSLDCSQHLVTNSVVRLNGDEATHVGYILAQHQRDGRLYTVGASCDDGLCRTADGWRLCRRVVSRVWKAGDPDVIQPE